MHERSKTARSKERNIMKLPALSRVLGLLALCLASVPILGAGNDCPPACIVNGAPCAVECNGPTSAGTCTLMGSVLYCKPNDSADPGNSGSPP